MLSSVTLPPLRIPWHARFPSALDFHASLLSQLPLINWYHPDFIFLASIHPSQRYSVPLLHPIVSQDTPSRRLSRAKLTTTLLDKPREMTSPLLARPRQTPTPISPTSFAHLASQLPCAEYCCLGLALQSSYPPPKLPSRTALLCPGTVQNPPSERPTPSRPAGRRPFRTPDPSRTARRPPSRPPIRLVPPSVCRSRAARPGGVPAAKHGGGAPGLASPRPRPSPLENPARSGHLTPTIQWVRPARHSRALDADGAGGTGVLPALP